MVFTVRCFKCGETAVRLVLGGRRILHAKCEGCQTNLLEEVMEFEATISLPRAKRARKPTLNIRAEENLDEDTALNDD